MSEILGLIYRQTVPITDFHLKSVIGEFDSIFSHFNLSFFHDCFWTEKDPLRKKNWKKKKNWKMQLKTIISVKKYKQMPFPNRIHQCFLISSCFCFCFYFYFFLFFRNRISHMEMELGYENHWITLHLHFWSKIEKLFDDKFLFFCFFCLLFEISEYIGIVCQWNLKKRRLRRKQRITSVWERNFSNFCSVSIFHRV